MQKHEITRIRRDVVRRTLRVLTKQYVTPRMLRLVFHSDDLHGFDSPSPDDHIKIFLPASGDGEPAKRDYTPRAWDVETGIFTLEFALHAAGPATEWASKAQVGDRIEIGGPRGSAVVPDDFDWYLLIGDATALPSIARRLETLRPGVPVEVFLLVAAADEEQQFVTSARCNEHWLYSSESPSENAAKLRAALDGFRLPAGDGYIWIAGETSVTRDLHSYFVEERHHPAAWIKAAAYWTFTELGSTELSG